MAAHSVTRLPVDQCPQCGSTLDAAGEITGAADAPQPGDYTLCLACGHPMMFTDTMRVRSLTEVEIAALPDDVRREFGRIQQFAEQVYQASRRRPS